MYSAHKIDEHKLITLFKEKYGLKPEVIKLPGAGSNRRYFRLSASDFSVIGVIGEDGKENEAFIALNEMLERNAVNVPHIINVSYGSKEYLLEDLGDTDLLKLLNGDKRLPLAEKALESLIDMQLLPEGEWEHIVMHKPFSKRLVMWDLNYFKYDFLKPAGVLFDEEKLEDDFEKLAIEITGCGMSYGFMYRDFQSRNIMVRDDRLWFIDFQGARKGPLVYDAASFIWQARAPFSYKEREELGHFYAEKLARRTGLKVCLVKHQLEMMAVFRTLQVLGAYGFRGLIERKAHFLESIPCAINNLSFMRERGFLDTYPEILKLSYCLEEYNNMSFLQEKNEGLTVTVTSFSFKKGYPYDPSGNGGGFVFDCRSLPNPGRYDKYKLLTGRDPEVIMFLEKEPDVKTYIDGCLSLVRPGILTYIKRGFTSLQIGFGCTGGQHRSVYCAEILASSVKTLYPGINVQVIHREQGLSFNLDA